MASVDIALTRELGANGKLLKLLPTELYNCIELPCIAFGPGADIELLPTEITKHDIIAITSPQAADVFLKKWELIDKPKVNVATVGKGTSAVLIKRGLQPVYEPSDFTAETLARDLPTTFGHKVLYPTSSLAQNVLQDGLQSRGFNVTRLETYKTIPSVWTEEQYKVAHNIKIVTFASPSAVKTWAERCGTSATAVVIGPTSANAARKLGFAKLHAPEASAGVEVWAKLICQVAENIQKEIDSNSS